MINEQNYIEEEAKIGQLFQRAGWKIEAVTSFERIERIADRAMFENIMKDTTTFAFMSFGTAIHGLMGAAFGCVIGGENTDYRA